MSSSPQNLKRPRGLLKSKRAQNSLGVKGDDEEGPITKKLKQDTSEEINVEAGEEEKRSVDIEDWEDLKELFENAIEAMQGTR